MLKQGSVLHEITRLKPGAKKLHLILFSHKLFRLANILCAGNKDFNR
jgi:hypothetical protein